MKNSKIIFLLLLLCFSLIQNSLAGSSQSNEHVYDLRCVREAVVELENKSTGEKAQVEKSPKITIGTRIMSPVRSYMDADVFIEGQKTYRFTVDKLTLKVETSGQSKKIYYNCKGTRYNNDGSVRQFCGPWTEVFEIDIYGTEIFKGYEENGVLEPSSEIRFRSELPDGSIMESLVNTVPRVTLETQAEIWRIYREHQQCLMVPQK